MTAMGGHAVRIRKLGAHIGAEITGVDIRRLDEDGFASVYRAWLDHGVTVIRDQDLGLGDFLQHCRRYGTVVRHPSKATRHPQCPEITVLGVDKFNPDGTLKQHVYRRGAAGFHTDGAYEKRPFKATALHARAVPGSGGDTLFSCMTMACEALPGSLRRLLDGRRGAFTFGGRSSANLLLEPEDRNEPPAFHRLLQPHPETGRMALYFDPGKIHYIEGLEPEHSDAVIEELTERMIVPGAGYVHSWRVGDVVVWDNRCLVHKAAGDYPPHEDRIHWRVSIGQD